MSTANLPKGKCLNGFSIVRKDDGIWLHVQSPSGKSGAINLEALGIDRKGIIGAALVELCDAHMAQAPGTELDAAPPPPAFPGNFHGQHGMSLRDYFAAKAMQGFAADPEAAWKDGARGMARCSYEWADAMLEARKM